MAVIATYVFIDLETTSLPSLELNKTKITELSMVVVKRRHILDTRPGASPRVQHKMTLCFNPRRLVDPECTRTTGLCNDLLEHESDFNINVFNTINSFLNCFERPICLVAQNGHNFDFPILKNHFVKLKTSLPDDILCADSLHAFYDLWKDENDKMCFTIHSNSKLNTPGTIEQSPSSSTKKADCAVINDAISEFVDALAVVEKRPNTPVSYTKEVEDKGIDEVDLQNGHDLSLQQKMKLQNENTPKSKPIKTIGKDKKVRRKLFWGDNPKPKISFKLKDLYERVLKRPSIEAHRAENDCIMAAEVAICKGEEFVKWIDENSIAFSDVKPMTLGVPLGLLVLTGVLWGCTNPFIRQGTKGLRDVTATTVVGQAWAEVRFLLGNWRYVVPWVVNQTGSLVYLAAVQRAPLSAAVPAANSLAFAFTALTGVVIGTEEPLDAWSIVGVVLIMTGTALCCFENTS